MHSADSDDSSSLAQVASCKIDVIRHLTVVRLVSLPNSSIMVAERGVWPPKEQIADVHVPRVVEQIIEVPKMAEQIFDVLVPEMVEQLVKQPKTVSVDRIQERTAEQAVDILVPQDVEEPAEFFKASFLDGVQQSSVEQTVETPDITLAEKIVEGPVTQTQQVVNTSVQHVVDTVEVEKHIIHEKINQVTRHVEIPLLQIVKKTVEVPEVPNDGAYWNFRPYFSGRLGRTCRPPFFFFRFSPVSL